MLIGGMNEWAWKEGWEEMRCVCVCVCSGAAPVRGKHSRGGGSKVSCCPAALTFVLGGRAAEQTDTPAFRHHSNPAVYKARFTNCGLESQFLSFQQS